MSMAYYVSEHFGIGSQQSALKYQVQTPFATGSPRHLFGHRVATTYLNQYHVMKNIIQACLVRVSNLNRLEPYYWTFLKPQGTDHVYETFFSFVNVIFLHFKSVLNVFFKKCLVVWSRTFQK